MLTRLLKVLFSLIFGQLLIRFNSIIIIPIFVNKWNATIYGEWITLTAAISYLGTLDLGITQASTNKMVQSYSLGDLQKFKTVQHSSLLLFFVIAFVFSLLTILLVWLLPFTKWLGIKNIDEFEAQIIFIILAIYFLWSLPARIIVSNYISLSELSKAQWIDNIQKFIYIIIVFMLLITKQKLFSIALVQLLMLILTCSYVLYDMKKNYEDLFPGVKFANFIELRDTITNGFFFMIYTFANILWMQGSIVLTASKFGGLLVATFSVSRTLSMLGRQVVDFLFYSLLPDIASLYARNENEKLKSLHKFLVYTSFSVSLIFTMVFWFYGKFIILSWTAGKVMVDENLLRLLLIHITLQTLYLSSASLLLATNNHRRFTILFLIANIIGLLLSYILINQIGIYSIPISFIISETFFCYFFVVRDTCRKIKDDYLSFLSSFIKFMIPSVILIFFFSYLINSLLIKSLNSIYSIIGILITLMGCVIILTITYPKREKSILIRKFKDLKFYLSSRL